MAHRASPPRDIGTGRRKDRPRAFGRSRFRMRRLAAALLCLACGSALCPNPAAAEGEPSVITGKVSHLDLRGARKVELRDGAEVSGLTAYDKSEVVMHEGAKVSHLTVKDRASVRILGGTVSFLNMRGSSRAEIRKLRFDGGLFAAGGVSVSGGALTYAADAVIELHAADASFGGGKISGAWADGADFDFWMIEDIDGEKQGLYRLPQQLPRQVVLHVPPPPPITDCANTRSAVVKTICENRELMELDKRHFLLNSELRGTGQSAEARSGLRRWLAEERDVCGSPECIRDAYLKRIATLERFLGRFDEVFVRALCGGLVDPAARSALLRATADVDDINNDGLREIVQGIWDNAARISRPAYYVDGRDRNPLPIVPAAAGRKEYRTYGVQRFRYDRRVFFLYSFDELLKEPAYVSCIGPANKERILCDFENAITSEVEFAMDGESAVCEAAAAGSPDIRVVAFAPVPAGANVDPNCPETSVRGAAKCDVDNDGRLENVLALSYSNGSGRGCERDYFELLDGQGARLDDGAKRRAFLAMQGLGESGYSGRNCAPIVNRLFRYRDRTYFERNAGSHRDEPHEISLLIAGRLSVVCGYRGTVKTSFSVRIE